MATNSSTLAQGGPKVTVHIITGKASRNSREMKGRTLLIGSDPECDVQMRSLDVADHHCLLTRRSGVLIAKQLSSDFPVYVNGETTVEQRIEDGDLLKIGPFELKVSIEGAQPSGNERPPVKHAPLEPMPETKSQAQAAADSRPERQDPSPAVELSSPQVSQTPGVADEAAFRSTATRPAPSPNPRDESPVESRQAVKRPDSPFESTAEVFKRLSNLKQSEIDRQKQELAQEREKLQKEREKLRLEIEAVDRDRNELSNQRQQFQDQAEPIRDRLESLQRSEAELAKRQADVAEQLRRFEKEQSRFADRKQKFFEVRGRLIAQYRRRRNAVAELVESIEQRTADLQEQEEQIAAAFEQIENRARELDDRQARLSDQEQRLTEWEAALGEKRAQSDYQIRRQAEETDASASAALDEIERRRKAVEEAERRLATSKADLTQSRHTLEREQKELAARIDAVGAESSEVSQLAESLHQERQRLEEDMRSLACERDELAEMRRQLERRQTDRTTNEQAEAADWRRQADERQKELDAQAAEIQRRRLSLDRQARSHRRQVQRLREVSLKVAQRRREAAAILDGLQRAGHLDANQVDILQDSHQELLSSLQEYAEQAADSRRELLTVRDAVRIEGAELDATQHRVRKQLRELILDCETSDGSQSAMTADRRRADIARRLEESLREWSGQLVRLQQALGSQTEGSADRAVDSTEAYALPEDEGSVSLGFGAEPLSETPSPLADATLRLFETDDIEITGLEPVGAEAFDSFGGESALERLSPPGFVADEELIRRAEEAGIAKAADLRSGRLTDYQIATLRAGQGDSLRIGDAIVLDEIHQDSIATIYKVRTENGVAAARMFDPRWCKDPQLRKTFEINVKPLTSFRHPAVAAIERTLVDERVEDGLGVWHRYGLLGEYVDGVSLAALAAQGVPGAVLVNICLLTVRGLIAANRGGILHHNLRPTRILVDQAGAVKIVGFGEPMWISKIQRCEDRKVRSYVAPEQFAAGQPADIRSDLYSVGRIFGEMLAATRSDELPNGFVALMTQLCDDRPEHRCRYASEILELLEEMAGEAGSDTPWPHLLEAIAAAQASGSQAA